MRGKTSGLILALLFVLCTGSAFAQTNFPELTGRVVDNADMLDEKTERVLIEQLTAHEQATGNQIVVVTLPDLQGYTIEDYGYQLGRHWQLGQEGKDNGALLIVAKDERKVRIEVGYGLEGELTDAVVSSIIHMVILPQFRQNDFNGGISAGVTSMIQALGGEYAIPERKRDEPSPAMLGFLGLFVFIWILLAALGGMGGGRRGRYGGTGYYGGGGGFSGRGGGFGGGGGFSGGGGSFGGGGASGGW